MKVRAMGKKGLMMTEFKECDLVAWIGVSCNKYMIEAVEDDGYFFGRNENGENELFFMPFADARSQLIRVGRLDKKKEIDEGDESNEEVQS